MASSNTSSVPLRPAASSSEAPSARLEEILSGIDGPRIEELSDSENEYEDMGTLTREEEANIAYLDSIRIPITDSLQTDTSEVQDETLEIVLPFLEGNPHDFPLNIYGLPKLQRVKHIAFLENGLGDYPAGFAVMDASRPWLVYWGLQGMSSLGHDVSEYRDRVVHTFALIQHPTGGYGGGFGQLPHLACTYATILSLAMVGCKEAYESVNRKTLWQYLGQMKQPDGGFTMCAGGEEDIRGAYCALVAISLLDLPLELPPEAPARTHGLTTFLDKLGDWVSQCQTYEGGLSAAPGNEAHGAYAFCGLACLSIMGAPKQTLNTYLDMPMLTHWLSSRQCSPEGGYNGRTNKLVDGCYSHWIGGCWALVEAATSRPMFNRTALARYILSAAQDKKGGLRDKPGKRADAYHTCYNLAGLSAAQHVYVYDEGKESGVGNGNLCAPYRWRTDALWERDPVWEANDLVGEVHPVFVIPYQAAEECRKYFEAKEGF